MLIMNDFPSFNLNLLIQPLPVTAAFGSAFGGPTGRTSIKTSQAVFIQAVTEVHSAENQEPLAVIDLALRWYYLSKKENTRLVTSHKDMSAGKAITEILKIQWLAFRMKFCQIAT